MIHTTVFCQSIYDIGSIYGPSGAYAVTGCGRGHVGTGCEAAGCRGVVQQLGVEEVVNMEVVH